MEISELFEAAYNRLVQLFPVLDPLICSLFWSLEIDPRTCGEFVELIEGDREFWIWMAPPLVSHPRFVATYEVGDDKVFLWSLRRHDEPVQQY